MPDRCFLEIDWRAANCLYGTPKANVIGWEAGVPHLASCCFFLFLQEVGSGAMASPSSVCLGCRSVRSLSCPSLPISFYLVLVFFLLCRWCLFLCSCPLVSVCGCSCWFLLVLLPLAGAHVVGGGFFCVGGHVCCGVYVSSSASPCFKESPRGAPLCMRCLLLLRFFFSCPVLLLLVHMVVFYVVLVVFDARARAATASLRIKLYSFLHRSFAVSRC